MKLEKYGQYSMQCSLYSPEIEYALPLDFWQQDFFVSVDYDFPHENESLGKATIKKIIIDIFKELGKLPQIDSFWLRSHSAYVGIPSGIYEKGQAFKDLYDPLKYDNPQVNEKVRMIKEQLKTRITNTEIIDILKNLQFHVEELGQERIYVEFVGKKLSRMLAKAPLEKLKVFEQQIDEILKGK